MHQVIIPTDAPLADFGAAEADAVQKWADYERRPAREGLELLILPPADVLRSRETSPDAEAGSRPFEHAVATRRADSRSSAASVQLPTPVSP